VGIHHPTIPPSIHPWVYHHPPGDTVSAPVGLLVLPWPDDEALGSTLEIIKEREALGSPESSFLLRLVGDDAQSYSGPQGILIRRLDRRRNTVGHSLLYTLGW